MSKQTSKTRVSRFLLILASLQMGVLSTSSPLLWARWATVEDAESSIEFENTEMLVNADGSHVDTIEHKVKILKESARDSFATRRLFYNSMTSSIKILEAKTINDGVEFKVDPGFIEDKPLASSPKGFDQQNQILIAYPQVKIQSEIYLKYVMTVRESPIPHFFSSSFIYGSETLEKSGFVRIRSEVPLFVEAQDINKVLKIRQSTDSDNPKRPYTAEITLRKPVIKVPVDEVNAHLDPKNLPWVEISTSRDWSQMAKPVLSKYEEILSQPLPKAFEKILAVAKTKSFPIDQINYVTSQLATNINYLGDWRPISGLYIPHDLATIADTKLADCKDFSAATASILRHLGMNAEIAWVKRGMGIHESPTNLPTLSEFNHAIVHISLNGKSMWIDPTNFSSFAQGIFPDIADRKALILNSLNPRMARIPSLEAIDGVVSLTKTIQIEDEEEFKVRGILEMKGIAAVPYAGISLKASKQSIDYGLIRAMGDENRITEWKVENYDLSSRISQDLSFKFNYLEKDMELKTSAGPALALSSGSYIPTLLTKPTDRVSDLFLGTPLSVQRSVVVNNIAKMGTQSLNCTIDSPWISARREIIDQPKGVQIKDSMTIKKANIPNSELKSPEFSRLQNTLQGCFNGVAIVYKKIQ